MQTNKKNEQFDLLQEKGPVDFGILIQSYLDIFDWVKMSWNAVL